jgi:hypothetical protein
MQVTAPAALVLQCWPAGQHMPFRQGGFPSGQTQDWFWQWTPGGQQAPPGHAVHPGWQHVQLAKLGALPCGQHNGIGGNVFLQHPETCTLVG